MPKNDLVEDHKTTLRVLGPGCSPDLLVESACRMLDDVHAAVRFGAIVELGKLLAPHLNSQGMQALTNATLDAEQEATSCVLPIPAVV